jgi:undecaprenyl-diphosphatase
MSPTILQIIILGLIQGAAELLPVSSSAHVIVAEKFMGLDPADPAMTFLLVMLHTGTMFAVIGSPAQFVAMAKRVVAAMACTAAVGYPLMRLIEKVGLGGGKNAEVEQLFSSLPLIAGALLGVGILILVAAFRAKTDTGRADLSYGASCGIGAIQGVAVPFRGFSRSGGTISVGLLAGVGRRAAEEFSFALAVAITPLAIAKEFHRLWKVHPEAVHPAHLLAMMQPGLVGLGGSFVAGLLALRWLSRWLEAGRWQYFGYYCVAASVVVFVLAITAFH